MNCKYTITRNLPSTWVGPDGRPVEGREIGFLTDQQVAGKIKVPNAQLTPDNVDALIQTECANLDAIGRLGQ